MTETHDYKETYTIQVPSVVGLSKNKNWILNLNNYRNAHYLVLNKAKVNFKELVNNEISKLPKFTELSNIEYVLYRDTKRHCDVANVCSIVDKFFCDALVEAGKLPDDNYEYLKSISYRWGGVADTAYVEINLKGKIEMKLNFNLVLDNNDIVNAVKAYVAKAYPEFEQKLTEAKVALTSKEGEISCEFVFSGDKDVTIKSNSNDAIGSGVLSDRGVSDSKSEPKSKGPVQAPEEAKQDEPKEPDVSGTTFDKPAEPESTSKGDDKSEPAKEGRKALFGNRNSNANDGSVQREGGADRSDSVSSGSSATDSGEQPAPSAAKIGASIFGRKKIA